MAQKSTGFYLVPPSGAWPFIQQVCTECPLGSSAEDQSKVPAATGGPLGEGRGQTVKQINCTRTGAWCSLESLRKMDVSVTPVGSYGVNFDLELGDLCAERGCYREPAMMSGHRVCRVGQDRHSPTQSLSYRSVWDSHPAVQL